MKEKEASPVHDYWRFTRELRAQLNLIKVLERQFFELDDLCEYAIRNDITVPCGNAGKRISVIDDCLGKQQAAVFDKLRVEVGNLYELLSNGRCCFELSDK